MLRTTSDARSIIVALTCILALAGCSIQKQRAPQVHWNDPSMWSIHRNPESEGNLVVETHEPGRPVLRLDYRLGGDHGYVELSRTLDQPLVPSAPIKFGFRAAGQGRLEIKFVDGDGSVNGVRIHDVSTYSGWTTLVARANDGEYWWGGRDCEVSNVTVFQVAVATRGEGSIWYDFVGPASAETPSSAFLDGPLWDPNCDLPGFGWEQRRDAALIAEDPLVLEWIKLLQDTGSPERQLVPSAEDLNEAQIFNNALCAMAFLLKGEQARAERILDFYAAATVRDNVNPSLQNFFYNGEARGFFQTVAIRTDASHQAYHARGASDRWMGDMAWLLLAYLYHAQLHGPDRYAEIRELLVDLLLSWYTDAKNEPGGYIQHGWRKGDRYLHEPEGHPEGNIDAYAALMLAGKTDVAARIQLWLERKLCGTSLPLDLYSWRVLAFGPGAAAALRVPECDLRYRKTMSLNGTPVVGFYDHPDRYITNIWLDGVGHMACAYFAVGDHVRGNFYANQMDRMTLTSEIGGRIVHTLPYTLNTTGGYSWVNPQKGFVSAAAWYIFAKNRFNPLRLEKYEAHRER